MTRVTGMAGGVFAGQLTSAIIQAGSLIVLARSTDPHLFGRAAAVIAALTVAMAISDMGLGMVAVRFAARDSASFEIRLVLRLTSAFSVVLSLLVASILVVLGTRDAGYYTFLPLAVWMTAEKQLALRSAIGIAQGIVVSSTIPIIAARVLSLGTFLLLLQLNLTPTLCYTVGYTVGAGVGLALVRRVFVGGNAVPHGHYRHSSIPARIIPMLKTGVPFWVATLSYQVRTLDVIVVSLVAGPAVAGIYAVPARLSAPLRLFPTALNTITMPIVAGGSRDMLKQLARMTRLSWILLVGALAVIAILAEPLIVTLLGGDYRDAARPLLVLCPGIALNIVGASRSALLQASGDEAFIARMGMIIGVSSVVGVAVGAYSLGATGAALGMTITYIIQFVIVHSRKLHKVGAVV